MTIRVTADNPAFLVDDSFTPPRVVGIKQRDGSEAYFDTNPSEPSVASSKLATARPWRVLEASAVAVPHTGTTDLTALKTIRIPGGAMGANGVIRVTAQFSHTNSANTKTESIYLGGLGGTTILASAVTTSAGAVYQRTVFNRNAANSQVTYQHNTGGSFSTGSARTAAIDTTAAWDLVIAGTLADGSETITLEAYLVEILSQD